MMMILTAFAVLSRPASATSAPFASAQSNMPSVSTYAPGTAVSSTAAGGQVAASLPTYSRWDGAVEPFSQLNLSTGQWPYLVQSSSGSFTVTRLGASFTEARIAGSSYDFRPDEVKETIVIAGPDAVPSDTLAVGFSSTYLVLTVGSTAYLLDRSGDVVWQTAPFTAWDSSPSPQVFSNPVTSTYRSASGIVLALDPKMIVSAQYPLYLDPTWVVKGSTANGWTGTLDSVTNDRGDANLRLGVLADDFNDNVNEIWTVTSGHSFSLSGGKASLTATEIHASGSWTNLTLGATLNFASCGASNLFFRYVSSSNDYYLAVDFANQQVTLKKVISGTTTAISPTLSIPMSANTNYDVKVVAQGNSFQIWWAGVEKWSGTDSSPPGSPLSGNVGISETTSKCALTVDNVRARDPAKWSGNYTSVARGAASGNVATQVRYLGAADAYNSTDLWINSSSDNVTWGGWHLVKSMAAPGTYYPVPDVDQKRYYQVRAVLRTGVDGTSSVSEIDVLEAAPPSNVVATTNTGHASWYPFVGGTVNAVSGNLVFMSTDLSIQAKGGSIAIIRTYNSLLASTMGPFGLGTMDVYHQKLAFPSGGNVTWTAADGASYTFVTMGGSAYSPPPGVHDNLIKNTNGTYTIWAPDGSRLNFDSSGRLTSLVDRNGNHQTLTYTNGNLTRISDDSGLSLTLSYDASNRVLSVVDPVSRRVSYAYGPPGCANCLSTVTDPMLFTENYSYDASGRLTFRLDRAGHVDRFVYDGSGRVSQMWAGEWNVTSGRFQWEVKEYTIAYLSGTQTTVTNALGGVTTVTLNSQGNPTNLSGPSIGCALCSGGNWTAYAWDGEYDPLAVTDGRVETTTRGFDWMGNMLSSRDPGGNTTTQTFLNVQNATAFLSLMTSSTTPKGFTTRYMYYANGNPYSTILPGTGSNTSYRFYDAAGSVTRFQDFRGNSVTYGYDGHEFQTSTADAGGNTTTYQNDALGRTWNVTSTGGNVTRQVYDLDSRVTSTADPMGNTTQYAYDKDGRATQVTDPNNLITTTAYNLTFGSILRRVSAGGNVTNYSYDAMGDAVRMTDANRHASTYAFDVYRRMTTATTPLNEVTRYVYDAAGNLATKIEANGTVVRFTYDRSDRLVRTTFPGGATETSTYDADGNVVEKKAFELDDFYKYDAQERVIQTRQVFLDTALAVWHNYTYDQDGNRVRMDGPGGGSYVWDKNNRISSETDAANNRWTYKYGKDGQLLKETYPNGGYTAYAYDRDGRLLVETSYQPDLTVLESIAYTYDRVGNIATQQATSTDAVATWSESGCCTSTTDGLGVLGLSPSPQTATITVSATGTMIGGEPGMPDTAFVAYYYILDGGSPVYLGTNSYSLTGTLKHFTGTFSASVSIKNSDTVVGQIVFSSNSGASTESTSTLSAAYRASNGPTTYAYDKEYRLYRALNPDGSSERYTYDAMGNRVTLLAGGTTVTYSYNADNELTSSTDGTTYTYNPNGQEMTVTAGGVTTHYTYDYAGDLSPVKTTKTPATTATTGNCGFSGCSTTITIPNLLPSPQTAAVSISGTVYETDQIDSYPNCPSRTVIWYYVLNGVSHQLGSQTLSLNHRQGCYATFSGSWAPSLSLNPSDTIYEGISFLNDTTDPATYAVSVSVTVSVPPYLAIQYGPDGLRASEAIDYATTSFHFAYDLLGMGGLPQEVGDYNGTALTASYFYGVGSDRPLDIVVAGVSYLYHRDVLSSTTTVTDTSGTVDAAYRYDAYGNPVSGTGDTIGNPLRFTGLASDSTSGLIYDRARFYDPSTGRFLTPDPLGGGYAYAGDNPVNNVDPTGMKECAAGGCWYRNAPPATTNNGGGSEAFTTQSPPANSLECNFIKVSLVLDLVAGIVFGVPLSLVPASAVGIIWTLVSSALPTMALAISIGDWGAFGSQLGQLVFGAFMAYLATLTWWESLGLAGKAVDFGVSIAIALLSFAYDAYQFTQQGCQWTGAQ